MSSSSSLDLTCDEKMNLVEENIVRSEMRKKIEIMRLADEAAGKCEQEVRHNALLEACRLAEEEMQNSNSVYSINNKM